MNMVDLIGVTIGERYKIIEKVGEGGMQYVFSANDTLIDRKVALKTPKNNSAVKRFKRSAILAAKVNHPNVAKTLDYIKENNVRYLMEELISGADVQVALIDKTGFVDPYTAAKIFHHLAKGISAAHHAGVVHRDLKPTNIMVVGGYSVDEIKITDFGIAKMADDELTEAALGGETTISASQTAVGALPYMAPEAITTPNDVTFPADIWSLGAMMFQLITGVTPFGGGLQAVAAILSNNIRSAPDFISSNPQFKTLAVELFDLSAECMQVNPSKRPSADELVGKLSRLCYAQEPRVTGIVSAIYHNSWGYIRANFGDVFFHISSVYGPARIKEGDKVIFSYFKGGGAHRAHPVLIMK